MEPKLASGLTLAKDHEIFYLGNTNSGGASTNGQHSNRVYRYQESWTQLQITNSEVFKPRSGLVGFCYNNCIYVFGGQEEKASGSTVYSEWLKLNLATLEWEVLFESEFPRHSASCVLRGSKAYVFGGANSQGVFSTLLELDLGNV